MTLEVVNILIQIFFLIIIMDKNGVQIMYNYIKSLVVVSYKVTLFLFNKHHRN